MPNLKGSKGEISSSSASVLQELVTSQAESAADEFARSAIEIKSAKICAQSAFLKDYEKTSQKLAAELYKICHLLAFSSEFLGENKETKRLARLLENVKNSALLIHQTDESERFAGDKLLSEEIYFLSVAALAWLENKTSADEFELFSSLNPAVLADKNFSFVDFGKDYERARRLFAQMARS